MNTSARLIKARMGIILAAPFFGTLLMRLRLVRDDSIPTFCTNGEVIRYNEQFAAGLSDAELRGVLVHEVCHCAQGHLWRRADRIPKKWNHATDYQINDMLDRYVEEERLAHEAAHGIGRYLEPWKLPADALHAPEFKDLSSEEIYNRLPDTDDGGSSSSPSSSSSSNTPASSPSSGAGNGTSKPQPGTPDPKVPWREVLREFIRQQAREDYSWARPNRRFLQSGLILPSLRNERMGRLVIAIDTSGSIDDHILAEFRAETQGALDETQPETLEVIYCDAAISNIEEFRPGDAVEFHPNGGGGGTDFIPVFDAIAQSDDGPPAALIYLTDGHGSFPNDEPEYPVLWASTDRQSFPFGQVVALR